MIRLLITLKLVILDAEEIELQWVLELQFQVSSKFLKSRLRLDLELLLVRVRI